LNHGKKRNRAMFRPINIIFDGPPGPEAGRFVEVEDDDGNSIRVGEWCERTNGLWALRIAAGDMSDGRSVSSEAG